MREVLEQEGTPADMLEVEVKDAATAQQVGFLGSPSIRIDGLDVEPAARAAGAFGMMCRTYVDGGRRAGLPPSDWIRAAVREARMGYQINETKVVRTWASLKSLTPVAAVMSALATLACCLPLGIAGAAGVLGLSVTLDRLRPWLIVLAVILLGVSAFQMYRGRRSCQRRSRLSLVCFGLCATVVLGVMIFPQTLAELMAAL